MYLKNAWYCVSWTGDIVEKPKGIKVLGTHLVLFRKADGNIVALDGMCPHRFAPLHLGSVQNDTIRCPYHGLEYNADGQCVHNPQGDAIPPKARLNTYPVKEHNLAVWVWMGDKDQISDELLPPKMDWTDSPDFAVGFGYNPVRANYLLTIDNLLDLSHVPMIHTESFGFDPLPFGEVDPTEVEYEIDEYCVHSRYYHGEQPTLDLFKPMFPHDMCVQHSFMTLHLPSNLTFDITITETGAEDRHSGLITPSFHFITPADEKNAHYFYAFARNALIDNEHVTTGMMEGIKQAFANEDEPMVSAIQEMMGDADLFDLKPAVLKSDTANLAARRKLNKMIAEERGAIATD